MRTLIKIWFFELDLGTLFSFLIGFGIGMAFLVLVYFVLVLSSMRKTKYVVKSGEVVTDAEVKQIIEQTELLFKDKNLRGDEKELVYCKDLCISLVTEIATKFFPKSKRPLFELSVDEVLMLGVYISNRLDEVLDHKGIRIFRKTKISTIIGMTDVKKAVDENPIVKATKKYKIAETFKAAKNVINVVNPVYWIRKLVINSVLGAVVTKLCVVTIGIVGEETYKIYSKSVFNIDKEIDTGVNDLVKEIDTEINDNVKEDPVEVTKEVMDVVSDKFNKIKNKYKKGDE